MDNRYVYNIVAKCFILFNFLFNFHFNFILFYRSPLNLVADCPVRRIGRCRADAF